MFENPRDLPYQMLVHKFDIDGWQFAFITTTQGDTWHFSWTQTQHLVCHATFCFTKHGRDIRPGCPKCQIRMPHESWDIAKSIISTLALGNKIA